MDLIGICGGIATCLVGVSFIFTDIKWIRWFNLIGSVFFVIYGFGVGAFWTGAMNSTMIIINSWHLRKIYKGEENAES